MKVVLILFEHISYLKKRNNVSFIIHLVLQLFYFSFSSSLFFFFHIFFLRSSSFFLFPLFLLGANLISCKGECPWQVNAKVVSRNIRKWGAKWFVVHPAVKQITPSPYLTPISSFPFFPLNPTLSILVFPKNPCLFYTPT